MTGAMIVEVLSSKGDKPCTGYGGQNSAAGVVLALGTDLVGVGVAKNLKVESDDMSDKLPYFCGECGVRVRDGQTYCLNCSDPEDRWR